MIHYLTTVDDKDDKEARHVAEEHSTDAIDCDKSGDVKEQIERSNINEDSYEHRLLSWQESSVPGIMQKRLQWMII